MAMVLDCIGDDWRMAKESAIDLEMVRSEYCISAQAQVCTWSSPIFKPFSANFYACFSILNILISITIIILEMKDIY